MKFGKRVLSFLLAAGVVVSMLPAVYAENAEGENDEVLIAEETAPISLPEMKVQSAGVVDSGTCGENVNWVLTDDGTLTISGTGTMDRAPLTYTPAEESYAVINSVTKVIIQNGVTSIADSAFSGYSNLASVSIPNSVISIGWDAFNFCVSLSSIHIPSGVTYIAPTALVNCLSLTSLTVSESNPNYCAVTNVLYNKDKTCLLSCAGGVTSVEIPNTVTTIGDYAFLSCEKLKSLTLPNSVKTIGYEVFAACISLESINIPEGVTSIEGEAFSYCKSLKSLYIPSSVTRFGENGSLTGCTSLTNLTVAKDNPNYSAENNVLYNKDKTRLIACAGSVTNLNIPSSVTEIDPYAFQNTECLVSVTIPKSVTAIKRATFWRCSNLTSITIPSSVTKIEAYALGLCDKLNTIIFQGDAPALEADCFSRTTATAYYPKGNATYTDAVKQSYGGNITWKETGSVDVPTLSSVSNTTSGISVKWNAVDGAAKYKVQYKLSGGSYKTLTTTSSTSCTIASDKLTNGSKYYVRVCSVSADGTTSSYSSSKSITYAKQYKITYDANGGSGAPSAQTKTYGKTLTLRTDVPTRKGYTFAGWATSASGDVKYQAGGSYTSNSAKTLYAKWTANKYTIKFNGNGKDGGSMSSMTSRKYGTSYTLTANAYTRTGYNFVGWNTKADGSGTSYSDGASVKNLSSKDGGSITLYAQWKLKTYKVTFNANGGKSAPSAQTKTYGKTLTLTTSKPTRSGYSFQGWATSATGSVKYKAGADYTSNSSKTLYAVWKKK